MAISRAERRAERRPNVESIFAAEQVDPALDLLELMEFAWHDCYGEITPPEALIEDVLLCSDGTLAGLISAVRLAVIDSRDVMMWARAKRLPSGQP